MSDTGIDFSSTNGVTSEGLSTDAGIQYSLAVNTEMAYSDIRKLEIVIIRCLEYAQRLTGDQNLKNGIQTIQQTITAVRSLQIALRQLEIASGPIGWALALTSAVAAGASAGTAMSSTMIQIGE
jgi:hypothetical protein